MIISDLIRSVRMRINDTDTIGFQEDELLDYVNMGIQWIHRIINRERPELISETESIKTEPFKLSKRALRILSGPEDLLVKMDGSLETKAKVPFDVKYVPDMEPLKSSGTFPYFNSFVNFVVEMAAIRAQARNEFDMSLEAELVARIENQMLEVLWRIQDERINVDPYYPVRHHRGDYGDLD